jgi:6-phosphogluconolactonase
MTTAPVKIAPSILAAHFARLGGAGGRGGAGRGGPDPRGCDGWPLRAESFRCRRCADRRLPGQTADHLDVPVLNWARQIMWLVTGSEKAGMLVRLCAGDRSIPAGRVRQDQALLLADRAAAGHLTTGYKRGG